MSSAPEPMTQDTPADAATIETLYRTLLAHWNARDAVALAGLFSEAGHLVGFDGSVLNGRAAIESHLLVQLGLSRPMV